MQENWETELSMNSLHLLSSSPTTIPGALTTALAWSQPLRSCLHYHAWLSVSLLLLLLL